MPAPAVFLFAGQAASTKDAAANKQRKTSEDITKDDEAQKQVGELIVAAGLHGHGLYNCGRVIKLRPAPGALILVGLFFVQTRVGPT